MSGDPGRPQYNRAMRFTRFVVFASAFPFAAVGLAFLVAPFEMSARVGIALASAAADNDARAVYGGLQVACAAVLAAAAWGDAAQLRAGLAAQLALYGGLVGARCLSLALVGLPSAPVLTLLAAEGVALAAGAVAWRRLRRARFPSSADSIARAAPNNLDELLPLVEAFHREQGYATADAALRETVAALLADSRAGGVLIARAGGRAIGYAALCLGFSIEFRGRDAFVDELFVVPERRGAGFGRALLRALEAEASRGDVRQLHLEVEQHNDAARRLYLGEGFSTNGRELLSKALR